MWWLDINLCYLVSDLYNITYDLLINYTSVKKDSLYYSNDKSFIFIYEIEFYWATWNELLFEGSLQYTPHMQATS